MATRTLVPPARNSSPDRTLARRAGLRMVSDEGPGIRRLRCGRGFRYRYPDGTAVPLRSEDRLRIEDLAIPPAWTDVWIAVDPQGHLQATGRDQRGRKQFLYHPRWAELRTRAKFDRMADFGRALPAIRQRLREDLGRRGLPREKVLAVVVELLQETLLRVGNREYAYHNRSFGLTTLRSHHVRVEGGRLRFQFRGKSGKIIATSVRHPRLARAVKACRELPGHLLFQYRDEDGRRCPVESGDVNEYLREVSGQDFTAKDFRTWGGTVLALRALAEIGPPAGDSDARRKVATAVKAVASMLANTPAVCRQHYIHPRIFEAYGDGRVEEVLRGEEAVAEGPSEGLTPAERATLRLLD